MPGKIIEISTIGSRVYLANAQLVISRPDQKDATVAVEDISVLVIDDPRATLSQALINALLEANAVIVLTNQKHMPSGYILPVESNSLQTQRYWQQIEMNLPLKKRIWQQIVKEKIRAQARLLEQTRQDDFGLNAIATRVKSGDTDNTEARAAQIYWPRLYDKDFRRERTAEGINACLNYGYAIIRAAMSRSIVAAGLLPAIGVFHKNRGNAFCLSDDLMEPFRPLVDAKVYNLYAPGNIELDLSNREVRAHLLSLLNENIAFGGRIATVQNTIIQSVNSFNRSIEMGEAVLEFPSSGIVVEPTDER